MDMRWNLDSLYQSFDSEDFKSDLEKFDTLIETIKNWCNENLVTEDNASNKIEQYLHNETEFMNLAYKIMSFASLTSAVDAKNSEALKIIDKLQVKFSELTKPSVMFQKYLRSIEDLDAIINSSDFLKIHSFYLKEILEQSKYLLDEKEEIIISKLSNTGSKAWTKLQNMLSSTLLVDINIDGEDKKLPLPVVRNMAYEKDGALRKKAYKAELKAYKKIEESSAASLNGIKGEVLTINELRNYESTLQKTLLDSRMDKETLDAMLAAMKESLPSFHKYYRKKGQLLGHDNGLPFYDMFAPMGEVDKKYSYEEARNYIVDNFRTFSDKLADYTDNAFEKNWLDAEPREGKRGGAFCANLHTIGESRILSNFTGSFSDVSTLAHELGHGYHGNCLLQESILNSNYPMPLAETASIFCETIIMNAALETASNEEAFALLEQSISDAGQVIVDIYSRFLFESNLFEIRKDHALSVNELNDIMLKAQKEAYGNGLDEENLHPYMWVCKPHYYSAALNFYNFPYAFGLLFAKGLYAEYLNRKDEFVGEYDKLLAATGKNNIADVAKLMNIDIRDIEFWRNSLKLIQNDIEKFLKLSE